ncbi:choice-of-anchor M domain-containing protein [Spirillospora sp. CA-255316]
MGGVARCPTAASSPSLGKPGSQVWVLPQGVLWPGWNTQDPRVASTVNRQVTWRLRGVTGPGRFVPFVNGDFGAPQVLFDSTRPYPQTTGIDLNTHAHGNWAFTAPGAYLLDIDMGARTLDGRHMDDRRLLRVFAGAGPPGVQRPGPPGFVAGSTPTGGERSEGDGGGSWWPARWRCVPGCSCWTSRSPASTCPPQELLTRLLRGLREDKAVLMTTYDL